MPRPAVSDIALGAAVLIAGALALLDAAGLRGEEGVAPRVSGVVGIALGVALVARGLWTRPVPPPRYSPMQLLVIFGALVLAIGAFSYSPWSKPWMLEWGPPELAALRVFELSVAVALARASHLRAAAMVTLGFILSVAGIDSVTGQVRLTFGIEALYDGIDWLMLAAALFVVADAAIVLHSPDTFLALYARQVRGWTPPMLAPSIRLALRIVAVAAVGVAVWYGYELSHRPTDLVLLVLLAAFGVACRVLDWNRLVLLLAFSVGVMLEEDIRRSMLISQDDPEIFLRPIALGLLAAAAAVLATAAYARFRRRKANPQ